MKVSPYIFRHTRKTDDRHTYRHILQVTAGKEWPWQVCRYLQTDPGFIRDGLSWPRSMVALVRVACIWPAAGLAASEHCVVLATSMGISLAC